MVILKDTPDLADRADTYAVSSTEPTIFCAVGLDRNGASLGRVKSNWSVSAGGNPNTRGGGSVSPNSATRTSTFTPTTVGQLTLKTNPTTPGVNTASAGLFLTSLYVDVDGFDVNRPVDQLPQLLPGGHVDGPSVLPEAMPQQIRLHVLTGTSSRGSVTFQLSTVSNYPGIAMNYPVDNPQTDPDMYFASGSSAAVDFSGTGDTSVVLHVNDYAAYGKLKVSIKSGRKTYTLPEATLPVDRNGNKIADRGWIAGTAQINDTGLDPGADEDDNPQMRLAFPPLATGQAGAVGDDLTDFEEYRGFVLRGVHTRTNPFQKDYFIEIEDFGNDPLYAFPALPTSTHVVSREEAGSPGAINRYAFGLPGANSSWPNGHRDQQAHQVLRGTHSSLGDALGETFAGLNYGVNTPYVPNVVFPSEIFMGAIQDVAQHLGVTDPSLITNLRRSVVAHEAGHSVNLWENIQPPCLMFGGSFAVYQGFGSIPTDFCVSLPETYLINTLAGPFEPIPPTFMQLCPTCPTQGVRVQSFSETDTLRLKEPQ